MAALADAGRLREQAGGSAVHGAETGPRELGGWCTPTVVVPLLLAVTLAAWGPSIRNGFVFDDLANVRGNPWIKDWTLLPQAFLHHVAGFDANYATSFYRPMMHVLYAAAYAIGGERAWVFHGLNVVVHALAVLAAYWLVRSIVARWTDRSRHSCVPLIAALTFSIHPVHAEPVLWIAGVTDLSYTVFGLAALVTYVRAFDRSKFAIVAAGFLFASLLSKETGAVVLGVMAAFEWIEACSGRAWTPRCAVRRLAPPVGVTGVYLSLRLFALGSFAPSAAQHPLDAMELAAAASALFARYMGVLAVPVHLSVLRDLPLPRSLGEPLPIAGLAVAGLLAAVAFRVRHSVVPFAAVAFVVLPVLPALYVPAIESGSSVFGERYMYLPVLGLGLGLGGGLEVLSRRFAWGKTASTTLLCAFVLWGAGTALTQARVWNSSLSLWTYAVARAPGSAAAHEGLCFALYQAGRFREALDACARALSIDPSRADARTNHATALLALGRAAEAKRELDVVIAERPRSPEALVNHGLACMVLGQYDEALASYRRALAIQPTHAEAHNVLGVALARLGRPADALAEIREAVRLAPENLEYRANLDALDR